MIDRTLTRDNAAGIPVGTWLYHKTEPYRVRVNGKCKIWKTRPDEFSLPVKYGIKLCFRIDQTNCHNWTISS